jgi:hypothetical protein
MLRARGWRKPVVARFLENQRFVPLFLPLLLGLLRQGWRGTEHHRVL